jgi:hypothetical protein
MPSVTDLYAKIGFKVDDTGLKEFSKELVNLKNTIAECLSGLEGFAEAAEKIAKAVKKIKSATGGEEAARAIKQKRLAIQERRVAVAEQREARLRESANNRAKGTGFSWGVALGNLISEAIINGFKALYGFIKTVVGQLWGVFKTAWQAMTTYRDYRRYTNLRDSELNRWATFAEGYATRPEIAKNMMDVQQSLVGIRLGQGNLMPYRMLGISADTTDPYEILTQARRAILEQNVAPEVARYLLTQMGFGDWAYAAIMQSQNEEDFQAALFAREVDTNKQRELAEKLNGILSLLIDSFSQIIEVIGDEGFKDALGFIRDIIINIVNAIKAGVFKGKGILDSLGILGDIIQGKDVAEEIEKSDFIKNLNPNDFMRYMMTDDLRGYTSKTYKTNIYAPNAQYANDIVNNLETNNYTEETVGYGADEDDILPVNTTVLPENRNLFVPI